MAQTREQFHGSRCGRRSVVRNCRGIGGRGIHGRNKAFFRSAAIVYRVTDVSGAAGLGKNLTCLDHNRRACR